MNTYLGVDNTQRGSLVLVCKLCEPSGEIRTLWHEYLRGDAAVRAFFSHFKGRGTPICFVTTWVKLDLCGVLEEHRKHGGQVRHYRRWELKPALESALPARYGRAEQLAIRAIHDTQFTSTIRGLKSDVEFLDSKVVSLLVLVGGMRRQIRDLESQYLDPDLLDIPF